MSITLQTLSGVPGRKRLYNPSLRVTIQPAETQNASRPGAVKITAPGREAFLTTYSATVGGGPHGKPMVREF